MASLGNEWCCGHLHLWYAPGSGLRVYFRNTLVCDGVDEARDLAFNRGERHKVVSKDGTLFNKASAVSADMVQSCCPRTWSGRATCPSTRQVLLVQTWCSHAVQGHGVEGRHALQQGTCLAQSCVHVL